MLPQHGQPAGDRSAAASAEREAAAWHRSTQFLEEVLKRKRLGPALHRRRSAAHAPARRAARRCAREPLTADFVKEALYEIMPRKAVERFEAKDGADFAYTLPGHGPLSRQRPAPAQRHGRGVPRHPVAGADARSAQHAAGRAPAVPRQQRPDPGDRQDRLGQVDLAGGDDRRHQQAHQGPHPHDRGPDRVRASAPQLPDQPARDRRARAELRRGAAFGPARGSRT